jgi:hypothetical protein
MPVVVLAVGLGVSFARAEIYKCTIDGKISYAERPCSQGASRIPMAGDELRKKQEEQRLEEVRKLTEKLERAKEQEKQLEQWRAKRREMEIKDARCSALLLAAMHSKSEASVWDNPTLVYNAKTKQMAAEEAYARECSGR